MTKPNAISRTLTTDDIDKLLKKALFVPCESKKDLHQWIQTYLGLDFPDTKVDPQSTSSPMDVVWEIYEKAKNNDDPNFSRILAYAARASFKTLAAAILEVLVLVHLERDCAHMAAIKPQSQKAQSYVKKFLNRPYLRDYIVGNNTESVFFVRYTNNATGENLTQKQYQALPSGEQRKYIEKTNYIKIVVCTMAGANSDHVSYFCVDECDVIPKGNIKAYHESQLIPDTMNGVSPITMIISTRKFSFGLVQKEIDDAEYKGPDDEGSGLVIRHWNILDVTSRCPTDRHLPEQPKIDIYWSSDTLKSLPESKWESLAIDKKDLYTKTEGYAGCLKNCKLFAMCQGRLATMSEPYYKGSLLKPIDHVINEFKTASPQLAKAQLLCWKPSTEGLIYSTLERDIHMLTPREMATKITAEEYPETYSRHDLFALLSSKGLRYICGVDWGFTHNMAVALAVVDGNRTFVIGAWARPELDPSQKLNFFEQEIKPFNPSIYPDTEAPDMNKLLKRAGFNVKEWSKGPGSVLGGIEAVRLKLMPVVGDPQLFFLNDGDDGIESLFKALSKYHWAIGADGELGKEPDDENDDECDALRYMIMNYYKNSKGVVASSSNFLNKSTPKDPDLNPLSQSNWGQTVLNEALNEGDPDSSPGRSGSKNGISWDFN